MKSKSNVNNSRTSVWYYERPSLLWMSLFSMILYVSVLAYLPEYIPFDRLGYFGEFSKYMISEHKLLVILIFWAMWGTHFCEAIYVVRVAHSLSLSKRCLNRWFFQTLLIGYPSTRLMLNYAEKERKKN